MRKSETKEIDGLKITVSQLPPRKGFKLAAKLFKFAAPALAAMQPDKEVDVEQLKPALMGMLQALDDDELDNIMSALFNTAYVIREIDGKPCKFELNDGAKIDAAFEGALPAMFQSLMFAIEVNFGDFFDGSAPPTEAPSSK
jgi:hypothetical protein